MGEVLNEFRRQLDDEENVLCGRLARDRFGFLIKAATNEFDWFYYKMRHTRRVHPDQQELFYILKLGFARLIKVALESRPSFSVPVVMFARTEELSNQALFLLRSFGFIEHGRRVAETVASGLASIEKTSDRYFRILLPATVTDVDHYERHLKKHYAEEFHLRSREASVENDELEASVAKLLHDNVRVFNQHFIGYTSDPLLDEYFFMEGYRALQPQEGHDAFRWNLEFGRVKYQKYILAVAYFIGLALKHERFCEALVKKAPSIHLYNTLTITCDREPFTKDLRQALNSFGMLFKGFTVTTIEEAKIICTVLSVGRKNTNLLRRSDATLPSLIAISEYGYIRSIAGAQLDPGLFLLASLRASFPDDYNRHQQTRERSMQRAVRRILQAGFHGLSFRENIKLKRDGRTLTDIDFVVVEPSQGTVVLCQLKAQDFYGADLRAKDTKADRLKREVTKWTGAVHSWLANADQKTIRSTLRVERGVSVNKVFLLTVSRHFSHSLKKAELGEDSCFATWLQLYNAIALMKQRQGDLVTIAGLMNVLRREVGDVPDEIHLPEPNHVYHLRSISFEIWQDPTPGSR
jgi:hypothetical protein